MNMKTILDVEIEERSAKLAKMEPGTTEYAAAVDGLTKVIDRRIKIEEVEMTEAHNEKQIALNEKQVSDERRSKIWKMIIDTGLGVAGIGVTIWGIGVSLRFEEHGTITTQVGKKFMDKILRK